MTGSGPTGGPASRVRPPVLPQRTPPVRTLHPELPPPVLPPAREDRRAVRDAVRARRRAEAAERGRPSTRRRPRLLLAGALGVLVLLVGLPLLLAFGPAFPVRTIAVSGGTPVLAAEVRTALQGVIGRPVALVGDRDVATALARVPAVERFTLVRRPPNTLELAVVPRTPVLQQRTGAGWAVLDAARVTISTGAQPTAGLPVVTVPDGAARPARAYATAVSAVGALAGTSPAVVSVRATSADDVVLTLAGGLRVRWGGEEDGAAKATALRAALVRAARGATVVDVSSPGVVLTR